MTIELGILLTVVGGLLGVFGFVAGISQRSQADGNWRGTVDTKLDDILKISADLKELQKCLNSSSLILAEHSESLRTVHRRLGEIEHQIRKEEVKK